MTFSKKTNLVMLVQGAYKVFCYFDIFPKENKELGEKIVLKINSVENGEVKVIKSINVGETFNELYISLDKDYLTLYAELCKIDSKNMCISLKISNLVTTPRASQALDSDYYLLDVDKGSLDLIEKTTTDNENEQYFNKLGEEFRKMKSISS